MFVGSFISFVNTNSETVFSDQMGIHKTQKAILVNPRRLCYDVPLSFAVHLLFSGEGPFSDLSLCHLPGPDSGQP